MANFLQALLSGASAIGGAPQPGTALTPEWFSGVMGTPAPKPIAQPGAAAQPGTALTPEWFAGVMGDDMPQAQPTGRPVNLLEGLGYDAAAPNMGDLPNAESAQPARAPRERRTVLDTVGRIADVLARVGGADALYQPTLDAREDRKLALEDRQRGIDLDALKTALMRQQVQGGEADLANAETAKLGLAVRGLQAIQARGGDVNQAWPLLAQQVGLDPQRASVIGQALDSDPNAVFGLNAALNGPTNGGDNFGLQPFYAKGPDGQVKAYQLGRDGRVSEIPLPDGFSPTDQISAMDTGGSNVLYDRRTGRPIRVVPKEGGPVAGERPIVDGQGRVVGYTPVEGSNLQATREAKAGQGGASQLTPTQRGAVSQSLEAVPAIRQTLNRVDQLSREMMQDGSFARGYVGGMIPGQLAGGKAAEFDKAQALLAAQIRTLIRTVGEGSMSDYESRLSAATVPSRNDSDEGRAESIRNLKALLGEVEARSRRLLAPPRPQPRPQARPQQSQRPVTAPQRRVSAPPGRRAQVDRPAGPRVGTVQDGYRFKGGNPASPNSWEKVR